MTSMEIDPAALSRPVTNPEASATPSILAKTLPGSSKDAQRLRAAPSTPRVDLEQYYAELKTAIGDHWGEYKEAISQFVLGYLNQVELSARVEVLIPTQYLENLHNQLICGLYANILRDAPDTVVASWVSANDKPTNVAKAPTGDAADQQLKREIMQLPPRVRNRIKAIRDEPSKPITETILSQAQALTIHQRQEPHHSSLTAMDPQGSANTSGMNRDLEIRRGYQQPLISEAHDLPVTSALYDRILPICYQEGLQSGVGGNELCSELVSTALGIFVKDLLTTIVTRTRSNAPVSGPKPDITTAPHLDGQQAAVGAAYGSGLDRTGLGIMTASYKKKLKEEEQLWKKGEVKRSDAGLLPVEVQSLAEPGRGKCASGDLRLAMELNDMWIRTLAPWQAERIVIDGVENRYDDEGEEEVRIGEGAKLVAMTVAGSKWSISLGTGKGKGKDKGKKPLINGVNGSNGYHYDMMEIDDEELGWPGATKSDQSNLGSLLDSCLNFD